MLNTKTADPDRAGPLSPCQLVEAMSDPATDNRLTSRVYKSRSGPILVLLAALFFAIGVGAIVFSSNHSLIDEPARTAAAQTTSQRETSSQAQTSNDTIQALTTLNQSIKELETSRQETSHQFDEVIPILHQSELMM
jgi:uncharacterized protein HemX